jgi:hypothetical protein
MFKMLDLRVFRLFDDDHLIFDNFMILSVFRLKLLLYSKFG